MILDRAFLRAERDYLRPPTERPEPCPCCDGHLDETTDAEVCERGAEILGCEAGTIICADCDRDVQTDIAMADALKALGALSRRWALRSVGVSE